MSISVVPTDKRAEKNELTRLICPQCGEKVRGVVLLKESRVEGLLFQCRRCGAHLSVTAK